MTCLPHLHQGSHQDHPTAAHHRGVPQLSTIGFTIWLFNIAMENPSKMEVFNGKITYK